MDNETRETLAKFVVPAIGAVAVTFYITTKSARKSRKQYKEDRKKEILGCRHNFTTTLLAYMGRDDFDIDEFARIWDQEKEFLNIVEKNQKK